MKTYAAIAVTFIITLIGSVLLMGSLGQAPKSVVNVTNQVTSRVTEGITPQKAPELTTEEKINRAITANTAAIVTIHAATADTDISRAALEKNFVARGLSVLDDGTVITASAVLKDDTDYIVRFAGVKDSFVVEGVERYGAVSVLQTSGTPQRVATMSYSLPDDGAAVIALGGTIENRIAANIVAQEPYERDGAYYIATNIPDPLSPGTILINIDASVVGISVSGNVSGEKAEFLSFHSTDLPLR